MQVLLEAAQLLLELRQAALRGDWQHVEALADSDTLTSVMNLLSASTCPHGAQGASSPSAVSSPRGPTPGAPAPPAAVGDAPRHAFTPTAALVDAYAAATVAMELEVDAMELVARRRRALPGLTAGLQAALAATDVAQVAALMETAAHLHLCPPLSAPQQAGAAASAASGAHNGGRPARAVSAFAGAPAVVNGGRLVPQLPHALVAAAAHLTATVGTARAGLLEALAEFDPRRVAHGLTALGAVVGAGCDDFPEVRRTRVCMCAAMCTWPGFVSGRVCAVCVPCVRAVCAVCMGVSGYGPVGACVVCVACRVCGVWHAYLASCPCCFWSLKHTPTTQPAPFASHLTPQPRVAIEHSTTQGFTHWCPPGTSSPPPAPPCLSPLPHARGRWWWLGL